jgi:hypothetical protein
MYFPPRTLDLSNNTGIRHLLCDLIIQQYETDLHQWQMVLEHQQNQKLLEQLDDYPLCNWMIVYNIMGFKEVPDDLKIYHGQISRLYHKNGALSPVAQLYAEMILNDEDYATGDADIHEDLDKLIDLIYTYK